MATVAQKVPEQVEDPQTITDILSKIESSKEWHILVYGLNNLGLDEQNIHHMSLLSGIVGETIGPDQRQKSNFTIKTKIYGVTVKIYNGSHAECKVSHEDIDLLIFFIPVVNKVVIDPSHIAQIVKITKSHEAMIWKHSIAVLTGLDKTATSFEMDRYTDARFETVLLVLTSQIQHALKAAVHTEDFDILFQPAGSQQTPDLPKNKKWFAILWRNCFLRSKISSMPAILKIAQGRLFYKSTRTSSNVLKEKEFNEQPIQIEEKELQTTQAVALSDQEKNLTIHFTSLLAAIPKVRDSMQAWTQGKTYCNVIFAGMEDEDITTVTGALKKQEFVSSLTWSHIPRQLYSPTINVWEFRLPRVCRREIKAKELLDFDWYPGRELHLLAICIPMNDNPNDFQDSAHACFLRHLCEMRESIISSMVIVLTHANKIQDVKTSRNECSQTNLQQFFKNELEQWKRNIRELLTRKIHFRQEEAEKVPIIPVGNDELTIDLSDNVQSTPETQYHWLSELLLHALPATKENGLPTLITINQKRMKERSNEYVDYDKAMKLVIEAKCSLLSNVGLRLKEHPGNAIGMILGLNTEPNLHI